MEPANLLIIMDDEHNPKMLGCYGHPIVETPNLDRLAGAGVRFESAYTNSPICVPARASLATGRYVHEIGAWCNASPYDGAVRGWGHRLRDTGHRAVSIGKLHYRNETDDTGFDEQIVPMHVVDGGDIHGAIRDELPVRYQSRDYAEQIGAGVSSYVKYDQDVADRACRWLTGEAGNWGDRPWVLFVSFLSPHYPLMAPKEYLDRYPLDDIPLPKLRDPDRTPDHPWWQAFDDCYIMERYFKDDAQKRLAIASYFGLCTFIDDNVGRLLAAVSAAGLDGNTRVVFTSDHGDNMGARRLWGKSTMYEESAGIPLILSGPGVEKGRTVRTPVSLVDLYPTILDCVGEPRTGDDDALPGASLFDIADGPDDPERTVFSEYHAAGAISGAFMLRQGRFKYVHYAGYRPELYDLEADPEELRDLAGSADHAAVISTFEERLRAMLDPEAVDRRAKADQAAIVARHGGRDAVIRKGGFGATPAPGEDPDYAVES